MKVIAVFVLFFSMMFSLEMYLDRLEKDIQECSSKESSVVVDNAIDSAYIKVASWVNP